MTELQGKVIFHNKSEIKVQAQIFVGRMLISTCVAEPSETKSLVTTSAWYDIYFKNGSTGWALTHRLNSQEKEFTLSRKQGRYIIS